MLNMTICVLLCYIDKQTAISQKAAAQQHVVRVCILDEVPTM